MVPTGTEPAAWPILHALYGWVLLNNDGSAAGVEPHH